MGQKEKYKILAGVEFSALQGIIEDGIKVLKKELIENALSSSNFEMFATVLKEVAINELPTLLEIEGCLYKSLIQKCKSETFSVYIQCICDQVIAYVREMPPKNTLDTLLPLEETIKWVDAEVQKKDI